MIIRGKEMETEKNNLIVKTTGLVLNIVSSYVQKGDFAIDCTMGNGNDTLSLVKLTGADGSGGENPLVYSFDVQKVALEKTEELLKANGISDPKANGIELFCDSHVNIGQYVEKAGRKPSAILFNLGFMPGQDKTVLTSADTSMTAIKKALDCICEDGLVSIVTYRGHTEGREEHERILEYVSSLPSKQFHVAFFNMINQKKTAPSVFFITRKKRVK